MRKLARNAVAVVIATLALACTVAQKKSVLGASFEDPDRRRELFEATLRTLDERPDYVDEFFDLALEHRGTLDRFIGDTVGHLHEPWLAELTSEKLASDPDALYQMLVQTLEASRSRPGGRVAIASAIADRGADGARALAERPDSIRKLTEATADAVYAHPETHAAFLEAMVSRRKKIAALLAAHPDAALALFGAALEEGAGGAALAEGIRELLR